MDLDLLREKIDGLDKQLVLTLAKREKLIKLVAEFKQKRNLPIYQPEREKILLQQKKKLANEFTLDQEYVEKIFKIIIDESKRIQKEHLKKK